MPEESRGSRSDELLICRPVEKLHDFPMDIRWEATRRHPYYLLFWQDALKYRRAANTDTENINSLMLLAAHTMVGAISVWGEPVDPSKGFSELEGSEDLDPAFLSGAVRPMTFRSMAVAMMNALPPADLAVLGAFFMNAGSGEYAVENDPDGTIQKMQAMSRLAQLSSSA